MSQAAWVSVSMIEVATRSWVPTTTFGCFYDSVHSAIDRHDVLGSVTFRQQLQQQH